MTFGSSYWEVRKKNSSRNQDSTVHTCIIILSQITHLKHIIFFAEFHHEGKISTTTQIFFIVVAFLPESVLTAVLLERGCPTEAFVIKPKGIWLVLVTMYTFMLWQDKFDLSQKGYRTIFLGEINHSEKRQCYNLSFIQSIFYLS